MLPGVHVKQLSIVVCNRDEKPVRIGVSVRAGNSLSDLKEFVSFSIPPRY